MLFQCRYWGAALLLLAVMVCPAHAQYVASVLPSGSGVASAASEGQQAGATSTAYGGHALLWNNVSGSLIDLDPGFYGSVANGASGGYQGGEYGYYSYITRGGGGKGGGGGGRRITTYHAALWHGSGRSMLDLNPPNFSSSDVLAIGGGQQVGIGDGHAVLWSGTAASAVILDPVGYYACTATGVDGGWQVGTCENLYYHAILWHGTAASFVDLDTTATLGTQGSTAAGVDAATNQQVGSIYVYDSASYTYLTHAVVWNGTAASAIDLNGSTFLQSEARAVRGAYQVGDGYVASGVKHAVVWQGTAASAIDLHAFLPPGYSSSYATGVDADGSIVGIASAYGVTAPVIWKLVSVPSVTVTQSPAANGAGWSNQTVTLTISSPFTTSGASVAYSVNGGPNTTVSGSLATVTLAATNTDTVQYSAADGLGQTTVPQLYTANIDKTAPKTTVSEAGATVTLAATDIGSGLASTQYILDGAAPVTYKAPFTVNNTAHTLEYWSTDLAGNVETHHLVHGSAVPPTLVSLSLSSVLSGASDTPLTVTGTGFYSGSVVQWNGAALATTYVSPTTLSATIPAVDLAAAGTAQVTVVNPAPGMGTTHALPFTVQQRCVATGVASNSGDTTFDLSPITSSSGFTPKGNTVHVVTNSATTYTDPNGYYVAPTTFWDTLQDGENLSVVGTYDAPTNTLTAVTVQQK